MKIKVKVKHLVWLSIGIILFIPLFLFVIRPQVELLIAERAANQGKPDGKVKIIAALDSPISQSQKWDLIRNSMLDQDPYSRFNVYVGPSMTQVNMEDSPVSFTWSERLPYVKEYVEAAPADGYLTIAAIQLASYYASKNETEKAMDILKKTEKRFAASKDSSDRQELLLEQAKIEMERNNYQASEKLLQQIADITPPENYYILAEAAIQKAELLYRKGKPQEAYEQIKQGLKTYEESWQKEQEEWEEKDPEDKIENTLIYEQFKLWESRLSKSKEKDNVKTVKVEGKVLKKGGAPVENVGVFLRPEEKVNQSVSFEEEAYNAVTDENGVFQFADVLPGHYQINLGLTFEQIDGWTWPVQPDDWIDIDGSGNITHDIQLEKLIGIEAPVNLQKITGDKVTFSWEKVAGAAYYNLNVGIMIDSGSMETNMLTDIQTNSVTVPIERFYDQSVSVLFGDENDIDPLPLLGFANPENRYFWNVEAYDKVGNLLTQSNGYRLDEKTIGNLPFFYLKERNLTAADRLLLDKKIDQALEAYQENLKKDANDLHSLRMIARLIGITGDGTFVKQRELALPYLQQLAENSTDPEYKFELAEYYFDIGDWESFKTWFQRYKKAKNGKLDYYAEGMYANYLMKQGKLTEARDAYETVMEKDKSHTFIGNLLALELYLGKSFISVQELAQTYPERFYGEDGTDWEVLITNLKKEQENSSSDYRQQLNDALDIYFQGDEKELERWLKAAKDGALRKFMTALSNA